MPPTGVSLEQPLLPVGVSLGYKGSNVAAFTLQTLG